MRRTRQARSMDGMRGHGSRQSIDQRPPEFERPRRCRRAKWVLARTMTERIKAWQCIGCGKIDAHQPCLGICQDVKVDLVYAGDFDRLLARNRELEALVLMLAQVMPRDGEWERSYRALQRRAQALLNP
jgi:hypothetical protein